MLFPEDVFNEILSYYPIKKHFHFHKISGNTELHTLIHRIGAHNNYINNTTEIDRLINEYRLTDNNYLQNTLGNTPLHIAARYDLYFQIYKKIESYCPEMASVKNNHGLLAYEILPYKPREWTFRC